MSDKTAGQASVGGGVPRHLPAPAVFVASGIFQYLGAALAVSLFAVMPAHTVAWLRVAFGGLALLAWRRPWRAGLSRRDIGWSVVFGLCLVGMNLLFYEAIARIALGTAVSLEFLGPVILAAWGLRGARGRLAALLALVGVVSIGGLGLDLRDGEQILGLFFALAAGAGWVGYMLLGKKVSLGGAGVDSLAIGTVAGAIALTPVSLWGAGPLLGSGAAANVAGSAAFGLAGGVNWYLLACAIGMGLFSSAIPYALDQYAFARISAALFALLSALLPVTSLVIGIIFLQQIPTFGEVLGLVLVSVAVALAKS